MQQDHKSHPSIDSLKLKEKQRVYFIDLMTSSSSSRPLPFGAHLISFHKQEHCQIHLHPASTVISSHSPSSLWKSRAEPPLMPLEFQTPKPSHAFRIPVQEPPFSLEIPRCRLWYGYGYFLESLNKRPHAYH